MSMWRRDIRELAAAGLHRMAGWMFPSQPYGTHRVLPINQEKVDPRRLDESRLTERTLETPPGAFWDGFRSTSWTQRDLSPLSHDMMLAGVQWMWGASPLCRRALEIHRDLVCSEGIQVKATSKNPAYAAAVQERIDRFWTDRKNQLPVMLPQFVVEVAQSGELSFHHAVRSTDGRVRIGMINPESIDRVEPNPLNAHDLQWIVLKQEVVTGTYASGETKKQQHFKIVSWDDNTDRLQGEVFHLRINGLANASRGLSDLLPVLDWLDQLHQLVHSEVDRTMIMKAMCIDVSIDNGGPQDIQACYQRNRTIPKPGSLNIHASKEKWQFITPDMKTHDALELIKFITGLILGGLGIPEHFFYEANTVNKASAAEMSTPVFARIRQRQEILKAFLHQIVEYVLQCAREATLDPLQVPESECTFDVVIVDPDRKQYDQLAGAILQMTQFIALGLANQFIDSKTGATWYLRLAELIGWETQELQDAVQNGQAAAPAQPDPLQIAQSPAQQVIDKRMEAMSQALGIKPPAMKTGSSGSGGGGQRAA